MIRFLHADYLKAAINNENGTIIDVFKEAITCYGLAISVNDKPIAFKYYICSKL